MDDRDGGVDLAETFVGRGVGVEDLAQVKCCLAEQMHRGVAVHAFAEPVDGAQDFIAPLHGACQSPSQPAFANQTLEVVDRTAANLGDELSAARL